MTSKSKTVRATPAANATEEPRSKRRRLIDEDNNDESDSHLKSNSENLLLGNDDDKDDNQEADDDDEKARPLSTLQSVDDPVVRKPQQLPKQQPHKDPSVTSSLPTSRRLFIGNLHPRVSKAHLEKLLQPYWSTSSSSSKIMDIRLCFHPNGQPRGFAFCEFPTPHDAQAAIQALHGRTLLSRRLIVQEASNSHGSSSSATTKNNTMNATSNGNKYHNAAGRGGTRDSAVTSGTALRREMKREEINDKIAKLKRALQESNNP